MNHTFRAVTHTKVCSLHQANPLLHASISTYAANSSTFIFLRARSNFFGIIYGLTSLNYLKPNSLFTNRATFSITCSILTNPPKRFNPYLTDLLLLLVSFGLFFY